MPDYERDDDWDEHTSWTALLDDDDDPNPVDRTSLVDRLGPAFVAHQRQEKEYVRSAFIPVLKHTKQLHDAIHNDVFPSHTHGLTLLNEVTLCCEGTARRDMSTVRAVYDDTKRSLDALYATLDDLVHQSDLLFQTFRTNMHECVQRLRRCTDQMPIDAERLIADLGKKAKHLGAEDHARAKENLLRGILEKY